MQSEGQQRIFFETIEESDNIDRIPIGNKIKSFIDNLVKDKLIEVIDDKYFKLTEIGKMICRAHGVI